MVRRVGLDTEHRAEYQRSYRAAHPETYQQAERRHYQKLRTQVFDHYGWSCSCCGTSERLTIDHVDGDGDEHRAELFGKIRAGNSRKMYRWLIENDFPPGFQVLCLPCNQSKGGQASKSRDGKIRRNGSCTLSH